MKGNNPTPDQAALDVSLPELFEIISRTKEGALSEKEQEKLHGMASLLEFLVQEVRNKNISIARLRQLLFGAQTEKTSKVISGGGKSKGASKKRKKPASGHGRRSAKDYPGAKKVEIPHETLKHGEPCPSCGKGKVYALPEPRRLVRIVGMAPLNGTVYECERLRCNACNEVFGAAAPEGIGEQKYDDSVTSMIAVLKYGTGMPLARIERLQEGLGIPLPAGTQWQLLSEGVEKLEPAYEELISQAAQGQLFHNDDTTARILDLTPEQRAAAAADPSDESRSGLFTSGIISCVGPEKIALFVTGPKHAGENLADVLARREPEHPPPIQMCDALNRNVPEEFATLLANCNAHGRRRFVELNGSFPAECKKVLHYLRKVYIADADAKKQELSDEERLLLHQRRSGPRMRALKRWIERQFNERLVEPNSGLGKAFNYLLKHWEKLTLFLREPGAPLDNNICERALKLAVLHRKNALFFRTLNGSKAADVCMSLIHSAELRKISAFDYLKALLTYHELVKQDPARWMPWNYKTTLWELKKSGAHRKQPVEQPSETVEPC